MPELEKKKEIIRTNDVFGKELKFFRQRPDAPDSAPLIFWLMAGYFRDNPENFKTKGIFRVTSSDSEVRELELHMS